MKQEDIAKSFRRNELQNRVARFHALSQNAHALMTEDIAPGDKELIAEAAEEMRQDALALEKEIRPGYWQRLWAAIRGR